MHTTHQPRGPQERRGPRYHRDPRGRIQKPGGGHPRTDRDGDLEMDAAGGGGRGVGRGVGRGRGGRERGQGVRNNDNRGRANDSTKRGRKTLDPTFLERAIKQGLSSGDAVVREGRPGFDYIAVSGWKGSKVSHHDDGGVQTLLEFLATKATYAGKPLVTIKKSVGQKRLSNFALIGPLSFQANISERRPRFSEVAAFSRIEDEVLIVSVKPKDTPSVIRLNGYMFAGVKLSVEMSARETNARATSKNPEQKLSEEEQSEGTGQLKDKMTAMLSHRYNTELKLLDLSNLGTDPEFANTGMFETKERQAKFFPALMKVCDLIFTTREQKREAVVSVTLANNNLPNISTVTTLSQTFPELKNLDLSSNQLKDLEAIDAWRWKFRNLDHLILSNNPLETAVPTYQNDVLRWYPTLRILNATQVRSDEEAREGSRDQLPLPILGASFRDEGSVGEGFLKGFFFGYDTDRSTLARSYYDAQSSFSLSINTSAPRAPETVGVKNLTWESYIKHSRNLTRVTHLTTRMARVYKGTKNITDLWLTLPSTRHPDYSAEPQKWCIECHSLPGLPDPSGQSAGGVGGLLIVVHGEFGEMDVSTGNTLCTRSFDRIFVLGPGGGFGGVRVISDVLVLRAYGSHEAWKPDPVSNSSTVLCQPSETLNSVVPVGWGVKGPGKSDDQVLKEMLALDLSKVTRMTLDYSGLCLEQSGWDMAKAAKTFEDAKSLISMSSSPLLFLGTIVLVFFVLMGETSTSEYIKYTTVTGFFQQDDLATNASTFNYTATHFGLINRTYDTDCQYDPGYKKTQWQRFEHQVFRYNRESGRHVQYKVLYMGRHGEGYHNAAESYYGTPAWNCYWSFKDGNGTVVWADADLTPKGIAQAQIANRFWASEISIEKIPTPESYYTSPLTRCLVTANITFSGLKLPSRHPFIPEVKELFREGISGHTCDRRNSKTYIQENFPTYKIEAGFSETDLLWKPLQAETPTDQDIRTKKVLDDVFSNDGSTYISITSHSGEIASLLRVLGHRTFSLSTGAVIPVLVKAEVISGVPSSTATQPYDPISTCTSPPPKPTAS
ncbi:MAG: hypothetical protein Q9187_003832 [Circinaria calcarea]